MHAPVHLRQSHYRRTTSTGAGHLEENLPWVRTFATVEELRQALLEFRETYNSTLLIERHGFRPPSAIRHDQLSTAALAA
jgi:putative transposase